MFSLQRKQRWKQGDYLESYCFNLGKHWWRGLWFSNIGGGLRNQSLHILKVEDFLIDRLWRQRSRSQSWPQDFGLSNWEDKVVIYWDGRNCKRNTFWRGVQMRWWRTRFDFEHVYLRCLLDRYPSRDFKEAVESGKKELSGLEI